MTNEIVRYYDGCRQEAQRIGALILDNIAPRCSDEDNLSNRTCELDKCDATWEFVHAHV
jgi:hypothetical protein